MRSRKTLALLSLALSALVSAPREARGEVLRLKTGETIKGRVVTERSNEAYVVVEDYATGSFREIDWKALVEGDSERWQENLGIIDRGGIEIPCEIVTYRVTGGTDTLSGIVESEGDTLKIRIGGRIVEIERSRVVSREKGDCDATEIFTAKELYDRHHAVVNPADARGWFRLAKYAERVGAYAEAKEAYENAATDPEFLYQEQARQKATQLSALLKDREAFETVRDLKVKLSSKQFAKVREGIEKFPERHPDAGEAVKKAVEALKAQFLKEREKALAKAAGDQFPKIVLRLIQPRVKEKEVKVQEVLGWAKRTLPEEAMAELAGKAHLGRLDSAVTPEEARTFWDARPKREWKKAHYGAGTFVVEPPKPKTGTSGGGGQRRSGSGPAVQIEIPKPPTRDSWWEKESVEKRKEWIFANFVENSGLFEVKPKKERSQCDVCLGQGVLKKMLSGGGELVYLCTRCGGAQFDLTVLYR
jgi:hypothetical protein